MKNDIITNTIKASSKWLNDALNSSSKKERELAQQYLSHYGDTVCTLSDIGTKTTYLCVFMRPTGDLRRKITLAQCVAPMTEYK
jgi:hypothetical protein